MKYFIKAILGIVYVVGALTFYISIMLLSVILYVQLEIFDVIFTLIFLIPFAWATGKLARAIYKIAFKC